MTLNEYQEAAMSTAQFPEHAKLLYPALKLAGEAGEVAEKVGKLIRDKGWKPGEPIAEEDRLALGQELQDCAWYIAALAQGLGFTLQEVADMGLAKLKSRAERGVIGGSGDNR